MAIGARSQSARTYLEKKLDSFLDGTCDVYSSVIHPSNIYSFNHLLSACVPIH